MVQETIQEIAQQLGIAVTEMIPHYAKWFFAAAIGWILFGCLFTLLGFLLFRWLRNLVDKDDYNYKDIRIVSVIILTIGFLVGSLIIGAHIGDLISPEGRAYHQLIEDARGK